MLVKHQYFILRGETLSQASNSSVDAEVMLIPLRPAGDCGDAGAFGLAAHPKSRKLAVAMRSKNLFI